MNNRRKVSRGRKLRVRRDKTVRRLVKEACRGKCAMVKNIRKARPRSLRLLRLAFLAGEDYFERGPSEERRYDGDRPKWKNRNRDL